MIAQCKICNGKFSEEMLEIIYAIRRNFDNLPDENQLVQQAYERANSNYPAILGEKRPSKKRQIEYYREETESIKAQIYNSLYHSNVPIQQEVQIKGIHKFEQVIENIKKALETDEGLLYDTRREVGQAEWSIK